MTIKQLGGVFGRNPTFNDVTIEGQLTFDGDIDINSDLKVDGDLDVTGNINTDTYLSVTAGSPNIRFMESDTTDENYRIRGQGGELIFEKITDAASVVAENFRVDGSNNVKINAGNLVIGTSGKGIDFSATAGTGTSELLDDYEEGTWTPTITDLTNTVTATSQGTYTKVGRHVVCGFRVSASSLGSASGAIYISGLPFTVKNDNGARCTGAIGFTQNLNLSAAGQTVTIFPSNNQVYAALNVWDATVGTSGMQASELSATGALWGSLEYFV